tara:strand:- start:7309 stop:9276 length:1968 start_codon:yes stop_codon:yes gene_type:complete
MISEKGKPYILKQPVQEIVENSGGNKQKIAQQAQMGLIDPTAAVLAGMYIDRIREAEAAEKEQATTVAEQVFTPKPAPEAVSQMQLAQQGLGGAPAPKMPAGVNMGMTPPKMPMAPRPPSGMAFPNPAAPNPTGATMGMGMAPRPNSSVSGVDKLAMGPGMIPSRASGGLLAFAGGGDVPGYKGGGGLELDIGDLTDYSQYGPALEAQQKAEDEAEALAKQQTAGRFEARDVGTIFNEYKGIQNDLMPGGEDYFKRMQELYSPDAIEKKAEKAQTLADTRRSDDFYRSITLGALQGLGNPTPSTGQFFSDAVIGLGTAAKGAAPGILAGEERYRDAQDKIVDMRNEAPEKELAILGQQRAELAALLPQAIATGNVEKKLQIEKQIEDNKAKAAALTAQASRNIKLIEAESIVAQKVTEYQAKNNGRSPNNDERRVMFNNALKTLDLRGRELEVALKEGMAVFDVKVKLFTESKKVYTKTYDDAMNDSIGLSDDPAFQSAKGNPELQQAAKEAYANRRAKEAADRYLQNESPQPITYDSLMRTFNPTNQPPASSNTNNTTTTTTTKLNVDEAAAKRIAMMQSKLDSDPEQFSKTYDSIASDGKIRVFNDSGGVRTVTKPSEIKNGELMLVDGVIYRYDENAINPQNGNPGYLVPVN